jgi:transposase-like protein
VFGIVERGGKSAALVAPDATRATIRPIIEEKVMPESLNYTDEWVACDGLDQRRSEHRRINHSEEVYVVGDVHTNTIEGFWPLLNNGV